jgi:putative CocE/NonD family hydrolase
MTAADRPFDAEINSLQPTIATMVPMRDGVRLATYARLPESAGPHPVVLFRSIYRDSLLQWGSFHLFQYLAAGYGVVWQSTRGTGASEGTYRFLADERSDGYDSVEWVAAQPWCDGRVAMDGHSYLGMTQLAAAAARPPHLTAIMPQVPSARFFRESPYFGGIFMRYHLLNWHRLMSVESIAELGVGFMNAAFALEDSEWRARLAQRPVRDAADGLLMGDRLDQYRAFLDRPVFDAQWASLELAAADFAAIDVPVLLISGNFDLNIGPMEIWRGLNAHTSDPSRLHLLIGPWTHGQTRGGVAASNGPYDFAGRGSIDMAATKIAFLDHYVRGAAPAAAFPKRIALFVTQRNAWIEPIDVQGGATLPLYLSSDGGRGALATAPAGGPDTVTTDPEDPVVVLLSDTVADYADVTDRADVLSYTTTPLEQALTLLGEPSLTLQVSVDTPDADVIVRLLDVHPDGRSFQLGYGAALRLRYREGFDRQVPAVPGEVYMLSLSLTYIAHAVSAGHRLRLIVSGTEFPGLDPNPNTGEPIATAVTMQSARLSVHHDLNVPSRLVLPLG